MKTGKRRLFTGYLRGGRRSFEWASSPLPYFVGKIKKQTISYPGCLGWLPRWDLFDLQCINKELATEGIFIGVRKKLDADEIRIASQCIWNFIGMYFGEIKKTTIRGEEEEKVCLRRKRNEPSAKRKRASGEKETVAQAGRPGRLHCPDFSFGSGFRIGRSRSFVFSFRPECKGVAKAEKAKEAENAEESGKSGEHKKSRPLPT